jgi:hypothetical protein
LAIFAPKGFALVPCSAVLFGLSDRGPVALQATTSLLPFASMVFTSMGLAQAGSDTIFTAMTTARNSPIL